ncbi:MAG TPA: ABC transporter permease [Candidatus Baltobacteraceae bacterium]|nr:ABC transporter permease [Candidatus Baltobacteraceae bacterium]
MLETLRKVYGFRWLLYELVWRDLVLRYRGSVLGFAWTLLNPLLFMAVYTLVFSVFLRNGIRAYPLFLLSGMIPWLWVSTAISQAVTSILDGRTFVGKTLLPTELLVMVPVLSNGLNFLITIALLFPISILLGVNVGWALVFLPLLLVIQLCMTLGFALLVATFNVFYRDFQQIVSYLLMAFIFLTPIFYLRAAVPANLQWMIRFSPIAALISGYQHVFYFGTPPDWRDLLFAAAFGVGLLLIALSYFNRHRDALVEFV